MASKTTYKFTFRLLPKSDISSIYCKYVAIAASVFVVLAIIERWFEPRFFGPFDWLFLSVLAANCSLISIACARSGTPTEGEGEGNAEEDKNPNIPLPLEDL